jgi:hypothetical protein
LHGAANSEIRQKHLFAKLLSDRIWRVYPRVQSGSP